MLDSKDEIKQKIDIVELIGEYLQLKPAGTHGFKANCPFHSEKTPSFHVSSDRQIWHCFGCSEGGDCFSFVMKMEGMNFPEALMHLGQKVGVEIRRLSTKESNIKQRLYELNDLAARYYQKMLEQSSVAECARAYVKGRGITPELVNLFCIGYANDGWDDLTQFLFKRGYSETEIVTAGLGQKKKSGSGLIDRFRDRLMIPLRDQHGKTIGFTGRVLDSADSPKYMNSPETPIYHKGQMLFGLDLAKRAAKGFKSIIVVEGNLDVIASHKAGVEHVVASSGTAFTQDQLQLLSRYTKTLIFCFDQDAAGLNAAKRGITIARSLGFDVRALLLPNGFKDPDELIQKTPDTWKKISEHSIPIMAYLIELVTQGKNLANVDDKRQIAQELIPALAEMIDLIEQEHWIAQVANLLAVEPFQIRHMIKPAPNSASSSNKKSVQSRHSKEDRSWSLLFGLFINNSSVYNYLAPSLEKFLPGRSPLLQELYNTAKILYNSDIHAPIQTFFSRLRGAFEDGSREEHIHLLDEISILAEQTFSSMPETAVRQQVDTLQNVLTRHLFLQRRDEIAKKLRSAEQAGDTEAVRTLMQELKFETVEK
jgi:DNA primase